MPKKSKNDKRKEAAAAGKKPKLTKQQENAGKSAKAKKAEQKAKKAAKRAARQTVCLLYPVSHTSDLGITLRTNIRRL